MNKLHDTVTLITGGGSGLGRALVERFIADGANVGVLERDALKAADLRRQFGARIAVCEGDVTAYADNLRAVEATVAAFGKVNCFIGNAGVFDFNVTLNELSPDELSAGFDELFGINVKGVLLGVKACLPELEKSRGNVILTLSCATFHPGGGGPLYTASKHALHGVVRQLAYEFAPKVRVNGVAPGAMYTDLGGLASNDTLRRRFGEQSEFDARAAHLNPLQRSFTPEDYCGPYVFLASGSDAAALTGLVINADGGIAVKGIKPLTSGHL